jgi:hypothetical protein
MLNKARSLRGLLLLSGLILMAHTLVPHVHGPQAFMPAATSIDQAQQTPSGWLDVLTDLVDADMGEDHLEHFSPEKTVDFVLLLPNIVPALPSALFAERFFLQPEAATERITRHYATGPELKDVHLRAIALRGPPAMA